MSDPITPEGSAPNPAELQSALFAQLVMQQANMAFLLLVKTPHPESGKTVRDVEAARMFIDQLEMLETKTRGNLSRDEQQLLQQTLMSLRLTFVEAANTPEPGEKPAPAENKTAPAEVADAPKSDQPGKRFSKSYPEAG